MSGRIGAFFLQKGSWHLYGDPAEISYQATSVMFLLSAHSWLSLMWPTVVIAAVRCASGGEIAAPTN
jgi:hypothetical protein